ncbi:hypothetical protein H4R26_001415 [Coemansia thaxteri]|uniref:Late endosomal/lysosomal adaptor and MAPK and MTOR activator 5 n=1 Tax=Coemansia thaxteri TaxID=2663907 RepID=A0A9W8BG23_9FUNG|nr:hypothetical protein H4R26_001415 [Coemansia thaxteri]
MTSMEAEIDAIIRSVYEQDEDVVGTVVVEESGLCLAIEGGISEEAAGLVASIASRSDILMPASANQASPSSPVIQIEAESLTITIRKISAITLGVFKKKQL